MERSPRLDASRRARELSALAAGEEVDLLVVGGGITGCGVALDAASRGLSVALVERRDLATGTSRWSSKLVHGGLRYLAQGDVRLAWESARERDVVMDHVAPHLVTPAPFMVALEDDVPPARGLFVEAGVRVADVLRRGAGTPRRSLAPPRRISAMEALRLIPSLREDGLRGAILCWDGQLVDDARLVVGVARTAAAHGARILTYCAVERLERGSAQVRDEQTGRQLTIRARHIVNATGVWAPSIPGLDGSVSLKPSKGVHLVMRSAAFGHPRSALTVPVPGEPYRWVFFYPTEDGHVILGITDDPYTGGTPDAPEVTAEEQRFLLDTIARPLRHRPSDEDVIGSFAGLRPLISGGGATSDLSRRHAVVDDQRTGAVTVVGGKLTTYRRMAKDAVDHLDRVHGLGLPPSHTDRLGLVGAASRGALSRLDGPRRLVARYGAEAPALAALAAHRPSLLDPVAPGVPVLGVELLFGVLHEGALTVDDLLDRRTRLGLVPEQRAAALAAADEILSDATEAA